MRTIGILLVVAILLSGCTSTQTPPNSSGKDLLIEEGNDPKFDQGPGGFVILWNFSATWQPAHPSGPLNVTLVVKLYGRTPAGNDAQDASFAPGERQYLTYRTTYVGIGDYRYNVTARDANGTIVGSRAGLFETCLC